MSPVGNKSTYTGRSEISEVYICTISNSRNKANFLYSRVCVLKVQRKLTATVNKINKNEQETYPYEWKFLIPSYYRYVIQVFVIHYTFPLITTVFPFHRFRVENSLNNLRNATLCQSLCNELIRSLNNLKVRACVTRSNGN